MSLSVTKTRLSFCPEEPNRGFSEGFNYFNLDVPKDSKAKLQYELTEGKLKIYKNNNVSPLGIYSEHFDRVESFCKRNGISFNKLETKKGFNINDFFRIADIGYISINWGHSQAIRKNMDRQVIAYAFSIHSGVVVLECFNNKSRYICYRYVKTNRNNCSFTAIKLTQAIKEINDYKAGLKIKFDKKTEEKLSSRAFMESL